MRGGAIGDFILTLPALQALRARWPDAYIECVGYPRIAMLAREAGLVDAVTSLDQAQVARWFSLRPAIPSEQAAHVQSFDLVLTYLYDPDQTVRRNLLAAGARQVLYGDPRVTSGHAIDHLLKPLRALAMYPDGDERPRLVLPAARRAAAAGVLRSDRPPIILHPGSGSARKNWPLAGFVELAGRLTAEDMAPLFIGGDAEVPLLEALRAAAPDTPRIQGWALADVGGLLGASRGYVGNDSGITHLAAAVGVPTVALFGPTDPHTWGPRGAHVRIVRASADAALSEVAADAVHAALRRLLNRSG